MFPVSVAVHDPGVVKVVTNGAMAFVRPWSTFIGNVAPAVVGIAGVVGVYPAVGRRYFESIGEGVVKVNSVFTCENEIAVVDGNVPGVGITTICSRN
jgi:hypothetical protein